MTANVMNKAKAAKNDEWYTQRSDIEKELKHYKKHFKGKVVYCNCDDPYESEFFKFFALRFNRLGLKKLITTSYTGSPIANQDFRIFKEDGDERPKSAYAIIINEVKDLNGDGATDLADVEILLQNDANASRKLQGDGSFDSPECLEFLKEADITVSNPPFSIWRRYFETLMQYQKKFLILGNLNQAGSKEIRPYFTNNETWFGYNNGAMKFKVPGEKELKSLGFVRWFTNLEHNKRNEELILYQKYSPKNYPTYENYDAIEVGKVKDIPKDYTGEMGVPISFLEKRNPDQFDLVGFDRDFEKTDGGSINRRFMLNGKERAVRAVIKNRNPEV